VVTRSRLTSGPADSPSSVIDQNVHPYRIAGLCIGPFSALAKPRRQSPFWRAWTPCWLRLERQCSLQFGTVPGSTRGSRLTRTVATGTVERRRREPSPGAAIDVATTVSGFSMSINVDRFCHWYRSPFVENWLASESASPGCRLQVIGQDAAVRRLGRLDVRPSPTWSGRHVR